MFLQVPQSTTAESVIAIMAVFGVVLSAVTTALATVAAVNTWRQLKVVREAATEQKKAADAQLEHARRQLHQAEETRRTQNHALRAQLEEMKSQRYAAFTPILTLRVTRINRMLRRDCVISNIGPGLALRVVVQLWVVPDDENHNKHRSLREQLSEYDRKGYPKASISLPNLESGTTRNCELSFHQSWNDDWTKVIYYVSWRDIFKRPHDEIGVDSSNLPG